VNGPSTRAAPDGTSVVDDDSVGRMLLLYVLVGLPLVGVGWSLAEAVPTPGVSEVEFGALAGTLAFCGLWVGGFRPARSASLTFLLLEPLVNLLAVFAALTVVSLDGAPWLDVGLRTLSVGVTAGLVFTDSGARAVAWVERRVVGLVKLPPREGR
jgi:hypothetical protein